MKILFPELPQVLYYHLNCVTSISTVNAKEKAAKVHLDI